MKQCECVTSQGTFTYTFPDACDCYKCCTNIGGTNGTPVERSTGTKQCECSNMHVYTAPSGISCYKFCTNIGDIGGTPVEKFAPTTSPTIESGVGAKMSVNKTLRLSGDYSNLSEQGGSKLYEILGDNGAEYTFYIKNSSGEYYNFNKNEFEDGYSKKEGVVNGRDVISVLYPKVIGDDVYNIFLIAGENTMHQKETKVLFGDGTTDLNSSRGSNSKIVEKVNYQYMDVTLTLGVVSPNSMSVWSGIVSTTASLKVSSNIVSSGIGFTIVVQHAANKTITINKTPTTSDLSYFVTRTLGDVVTLKGVPPSETRVFELDNIQGLHEGMLVSGNFVAAGATLKKFTYKDIVIPAVDSVGFKPVVYQSIITSQKGNISFNELQDLRVEGEAIKCLTHGRDGINKLTGVEVELSNVKVTLDPTITTTTGVVSDSVTVPVTSVAGIEENVSAVSGIGIDPSVELPTVTGISGTDLTLSTAQTIESGQELTFSRASRTVTITGDITVYNMPSSDFTLNLDLEQFLTAVVQ